MGNENQWDFGKLHNTPLNLESKVHGKGQAHSQDRPRRPRALSCSQPSNSAQAETDGKSGTVNEG